MMLAAPSQHLTSGRKAMMALERIEAIRGGLSFAHPHMISTHDPWQDAGWTPGALGSALLAWYRSDQGVTVASGNVSQWNDLSGNGNNLSQGTSANRPAYTASGGPNGMPYLSTSGATTAACLTTSAFSIAQTSDVFAVVNWTASAAFKYLCDGVASGNTLAIFTNNSAVKIGIDAGALLSSGTIVVPSWATYNATFAGNSSQLTIAGTQVASGAAGATAASGFTLFNNQSATAAVNAQLTEFIVTHGITATQRAQVVSYLQGRYAIR